MFFDEDGDLAHEFYEETIVTKNGRKKAKLKRIQKNLTPQVRKSTSFKFDFTCQCQFCVSLLQITLNVFSFLPGNYKAGPPVHPCRFPSYHLRSLTVWVAQTDSLCRLRPVVSPTGGSPYHLSKCHDLLLHLMPWCGQADALCAEPLCVIFFWLLCIETQVRSLMGM